MNPLGQTIEVGVDLTNPGQFFACCGLLELADRLWPGTEGWFDFSGMQFRLKGGLGCKQDASRRLLDALLRSELKNTMNAHQVARLEELKAMHRRELKARGFEVEKKGLEKLARESPVILGPPFNLRIDWFTDGLAGGSTFKTWAGQQSVVKIAVAMKSATMAEGVSSIPSELWLRGWSSTSSGVPFNFDSSLGAQGSAVDVGFSLDPLEMSSAIRPLVELLAFIGLQRCRPSDEGRNRYRYSAWGRPVCCQLAGAAASGRVLRRDSRRFEFNLQYRTKYLKSFLPATPIGASI